MTPIFNVARPSGDVAKGALKTGWVPVRFAERCCGLSQEDTSVKIWFARICIKSYCRKHRPVDRRMKPDLFASLIRLVYFRYIHILHNMRLTFSC